MWTILDKANTIIQTLYIFYELYQFVKKRVGKAPKTTIQALGKNRPLQYA